MIASDFNYPGIDWLGDHFLVSTAIYDTINECALYQHVNKPNRYRPGSQPHILDLLLTSEENMVDSVCYHSGLVICV